MLPNMMPRVGAGKRANVFYNTGHGHLGWTLSAVTADMVAEQVQQAQRRPAFARCAGGGLIAGIPPRSAAMAISAFDLFKIGIGPSSSHTVGPMRAARLFALGLQSSGLIEETARIVCSLHGSLGATGKGHGSDRAVLLGLMGHEPDTVEVDAVPARVDAVRSSGQLDAGRWPNTPLSASVMTCCSTAHPCRSTPTACASSRSTPPAPNSVNRVFYSVGGGFVVSDEVAADGKQSPGDRARHHRAAHAVTAAATELLNTHRATPMQHRRGDAHQRAPLAQRRRNRCRPARHLALDAGLRGSAGATRPACCRVVSR